MPPPPLSEITNGEIDFYAHCVTKWRVKMGCWGKVGSSKNIGNIDVAFFGYTDKFALHSPGQSAPSELM